MKKTKLQESECPHCHAVQSEPLGAISTNCKSCGRYFKLSPRNESRTSRAPRETREVFCMQCGAPNLVATAALSTQCIRCSHYLELGNKTIKGVYTGKLYAYDDVIFEEGCSFRGMEATGRRMEVRGKVFSKLRATEEIIAMAGCNISGEIHALTVRIERGAVVKVQELECARLLVSGAVEITGSLIVTELVLSDGAVFSGKLQIPEGKLMIDAGATVQFDTITCEELNVAGNVTLTTSLATERVNVLAGGRLTAPVIRASTVEVSPGGTLQTRIEKYIPLEKPKRPVPEPEPNIEPEAEAA